MNTNLSIFIPCDLSLKLFELGFNDPCFGYHVQIDNSLLSFIKLPNENVKNYNGYVCDAILFQQAFDFLREQYNIDGHIISWTVKRKIDNELVSTIEWYFSAEKVGEPSRYKQYEFTGKTSRETEIACLDKIIYSIK